MSLRLEARSRRRAAPPPSLVLAGAVRGDVLNSLRALGIKDEQRAVTSPRRPVCRPPLCKCAAIGRGRRAPPLVCIHRLITLARTSSARRSFLTIKLLGAPFPR